MTISWQSFPVQNMINQQLENVEYVTIWVTQ